MRVGVHVSIAPHLHQAVDRAVDLGCEAMQIFPGNPRGWRRSSFSPEEVGEFKRLRRQAGIHPLVIHLPYLVNLAAPVERVVEASLVTLEDALEKGKTTGADFLVMHTGSHGDAGRDSGLRQIKKPLRRLLAWDFGGTKLLFENTAGGGSVLGSTLEEIAAIFAALDFDDRLGVCLDTCHAFAAGYDLATPDGLESFLARFDNLIGLGRLPVIHANDSKGRLGSHLDRHQHIGQGYIGLEGFRGIVNHPALRDLPFILETPKKEPDDDPRNIATLRSLSQGPVPS